MFFYYKTLQASFKKMFQHQARLKNGLLCLLRSACLILCKSCDYYLALTLPDKVSLINRQYPCMEPTKYFGWLWFTDFCVLTLINISNIFVLHFSYVRVYSTLTPAQEGGGTFGQNMYSSLNTLSKLYYFGQLSPQSDTLITTKIEWDDDLPNIYIFT